jgi:cobalt-zinc-cadmium resistance protein CzcA
MLDAIIDLTLAHRGAVFVAVLLVAALGGYALYTIPVDAFPDLTNNQVVVVTEAPGLPPTEVEQLVTFPIEQAMLGLPDKEEVRSLTKLGLSMVTVIFRDSVPYYFARQLVSERLQQLSSRLPQGVQPVMGLPATAFGELYQYTLSGPLSALHLKDLQEWTIKNQLRTVPGVSEVNTWGGETKQFQIKVDPARLQQYGLTLHDVAARIQENNANFGGGFIEHASEQYTLRGTGRAATAEELGKIVLLANQGTAVLVRDIAEVSVGAAPRQGATLRQGETVSGMVIMLKGENGKRVIETVKEKVANILLPGGVRILPFYDQSSVIDGTIHTVEKNLFEGFVLVTIVLLLFLGNVSAAIVVASVIPLSMLISFLGMRLFGISANLMSLGAIDFGMIVDGAVVMMENHVHWLEKAGGHERSECKRDSAQQSRDERSECKPDSAQQSGDAYPIHSAQRAAKEVARPMVFGVAIIIAVYLPILFLQGLEGRMFRPMAVTVCSALFGSLFLALAVIPTVATVIFRRRRSPGPARIPRWAEYVNRGYSKMLEWTLDHRAAAVGTAILLLFAAVGSLFFIGTEFMPKLDEGSILIETRKLPGVSLTESVEMSKRVERALRTFPEIEDVVTKIGRPDFATEAMGIHQGDVYVLLRPVSTWSRFHTKDELITAMDTELSKIPGINYNFTQPMEMRLDETVSGVKSDLAVKIFGDDFRTLDSLSKQALRVVSSIRGASNPQVEATSGVAELSVRVDRSALARYGLDVSQVEHAVEAAGSGWIVSDVIDGQKKYTVAIGLPDNYRTDGDAIRQVSLRSPGGEYATLGELAHIEVRRATEVINREEGQRRAVVMSNVRGRDLGSFVAEVRSRFARELQLPPGYFVEYGGQFENQERATRRLMLIIPVAVGIIFGLLYTMFASAKHALLVLLNVPFALVGGIAALWLRQMNLSLSASVGFIALFGVAVLNGVVLVSSINQLRDQTSTIRNAVVAGATRRLRPVLITALVASLGFVPMALATSTGAEIQRPLATVVIGGLFTATILTLFLLPLFYGWISRKSKAS